MSDTGDGSSTAPPVVLMTGGGQAGGGGGSFTAGAPFPQDPGHPERGMKIRSARRHPSPRTPQVLAVTILGLATLVAIVALAYDLIVNDSGTATTTLGLIATTGLGGLLVAAGVKHSDPPADG